MNNDVTASVMPVYLTCGLPSAVGTIDASA